MTDAKDPGAAREDPYFREVETGTVQPEPIPLSGQPVAVETFADDPEPVRLKPAVNPFLKPALATFGLVLVGLGCWELWRALQALYSVHWSLAALGGAGLATTLGLGGLALARFFGAGADLRQVAALRRLAGRLVREHGFGRRAELRRALDRIYEGKPHERLLVEQWRRLPDYENDAEVVRRLADGFVLPLDRQAHRLIWRYSRETALMVGLSPLASLDMILALWRSLRMIEAIAQVYGIRPSAMGRWRLLRLVAEQLAFVGVTELATDATTQLTSGALYTGLSMRLGQGLGAGLYTARIGLAAIEVCRPIDPGPDPATPDSATLDKATLLRRLSDSLRQSLREGGTGD